MTDTDRLDALARIRLALKGARGLALDSDETDLDDELGRAIGLLDAAVRERDELREALEEAWGIIANAGGGNWDTQSAEWRGAAERWRDTWLPTLAARLASKGDSDAG